MDYNILIRGSNIEVDSMNLTYSDNLRNMTKPTDLIYGLNESSGNILGVTFLFTIWLVLLLVMLNNGNDLKISFAASSFIGLILSWILWIADMVADKWMYLFLIMAIIAGISLFVRD